MMWLGPKGVRLMKRNGYFSVGPYITDASEKPLLKMFYMGSVLSFY